MNEIPINLDSQEFYNPNADNTNASQRKRNFRSNQSRFRIPQYTIVESPYNVQVTETNNFRNRENNSITADQRNLGFSQDLVVPRGEVYTEEWQKQTFDKWERIITDIKKDTNNLFEIRKMAINRAAGATDYQKRKWKNLSEQIDIVRRDFTAKRAKLQAYSNIVESLQQSQAKEAKNFIEQNNNKMRETTFKDLQDLCKLPIITDKCEPTLSKEVWLSKLYSIETDKLYAHYIDSVQSRPLQTSETQQEKFWLTAAEIKKSINEKNINDTETVLLGIRQIIWRFDFTTGEEKNFCHHVQEVFGSEAFYQLIDLELPETGDIEEHKRAVREQLFKEPEASWKDKIEQIPPKVLGNLLLAITQEMDQTQDEKEKGELANLREKAFRLGASKDANIGMGERLLCLYDILKFTYDKSCNPATQENLLGRWHEQAEAVLGEESVTMLVELYIPDTEICENSERMQELYKKLFPESEGCSEQISTNTLSNYERLKWLVSFINNQDINILLIAIETMCSIDEDISDDEVQLFIPSQQENFQWIEYQSEDEDENQSDDTQEDFWNDVRDICEKLRKSLKSKHLDYLMRGLQKIVIMLKSKEKYFADCNQDPNSDLNNAIILIYDFFECIREKIEMLMGPSADLNCLKELKIPEKTYERIKNFDPHKLNEFVDYVENLAKDDQTYTDFLNDMKMIYRHNKYSQYLKMYKKDAIGALGSIILRFQEKWDTKEDYSTIKFDERLSPIYNYIKKRICPLGMKFLLGDIEQGNYGEDDVAIDRKPSIRNLSLANEQSEEARELSAVAAVFELFQTDEIFKEITYRVINAVINKDQEAICDKIIANLSSLDQRVNGDHSSDEKALVQEIGNVIFGLDELRNDPTLQSSVDKALEILTAGIMAAADEFANLSEVEELSSDHPLLDSSKNLDFLRNLHILVEFGSEELNKKLANVGNKESLRTVADTLIDIYRQNEETISRGNLLEAKVRNLQTVALAEEGTSLSHLDKLRYVIREVRCHYDNLQHDGTNETFKKQAEDFFEDITNIMGKDIAGQMGIDLKTREKLNILDTVKHYLPDDLLNKHIGKLQDALKDYMEVDEYSNEKFLLEYLIMMSSYQKDNQSFSDDLILEAYNGCQSDYSRYIAHAYEGKEIINREELYREIPFPFVPELEEELYREIPISEPEDENNENFVVISDDDENNDMDVYGEDERFQDNAEHQAIRRKVESISKSVIENLAEKYAVYSAGTDVGASDVLKIFLAFREEPLNPDHWEKVTAGFKYLEERYQEGTYFIDNKELYNQLSSLFVPPSNKTSHTLVDVDAWMSDIRSNNDHSRTGMTEKLDAIDLEGYNNGQYQDYTKFTDYLKDEDNREALKNYCENVLGESENTYEAAISTRLEKILKIYENGIPLEPHEDIAKNFRLIKGELSNCSKPVQISLRLAGISIQTGKGRKNSCNDGERNGKRLRTEDS